MFADAEVPRDLDLVEVPFPERGGPRMVRGGGAAEADAARQIRPEVTP